MPSPPDKSLCACHPIHLNGLSVPMEQGLDLDLTWVCLVYLLISLSGQLTTDTVHMEVGETDLMLHITHTVCCE